MEGSGIEDPRLRVLEYLNSIGAVVSRGTRFGSRGDRSLPPPLPPGEAIVDASRELSARKEGRIALSGVVSNSRARALLEEIREKVDEASI